MAQSIQPGLLRLLVLFPVAMLMMVAGAYPLAMICFVLLTAQHWVLGERRKAWGIALLAGAASGYLLGSLTLAAAHGLLAAAGIALAVMAARGWSYGRRLAVVSGCAFAVMAAVMAANWRAVHQDVTVFMNSRIAELTEAGAANADAVEILKWCNLNLVYVAYGLVFGSVLLQCAFVLCVLDRWQRDPEAVARRKPTGFQRMKVPDWAVWFAIALAVLWFAEDRWHNDVLRALTWNAAIGMTFLYWLNGVSILLYALSVFKATAFASFLVIAGFMIFQGLLPLLGVFGFFDTWYNFRMRFRRIALLRRLSYRGGNGDS